MPENIPQKIAKCNQVKNTDDLIIIIISIFFIFMSVQATAGACNAVNILVQISQLPISGELLVQMVIGKAEERVVGIQEQVKVDYGARFAIPGSEGPEPEERGCTTTSTEKIKVRYCVNKKFAVYLLTISLIKGLDMIQEH